MDIPLRNDPQRGADYRRYYRQGQANTRHVRPCWPFVPCVRRLISIKGCQAHAIGPDRRSI